MMRDSRLDITSLVHAAVPRTRTQDEADAELRMPVALHPLSMPFQSSSPSSQVQRVSVVNDGERGYAAPCPGNFSPPREAQVAPSAPLVARQRHSDGAQMNSPSFGLLQRHDSRMVLPGAVGRARTPSPARYGQGVSMHREHQQQPYHHQHHRQVDYDQPQRAHEQKQEHHEYQFGSTTAGLVHTPPSPPSVSTTAAMTATPPSLSRQCAESPSPLASLINHRSYPPVVQDASKSSCPTTSNMMALPPTSCHPQLPMPPLPTRSAPPMIASQLHAPPQYHNTMHTPCTTSSSSRALHAPTSPQTVIVKTPRGKRHRCTYAGCGRDFSRLSNLKAHWRRHSGEEPYACMHCTRKFKWRSSLKSHELGCVYEFSKSNNSLRWVYGERQSHLAAPSASTVIATASGGGSQQRPRSLPFPHGVV